MIITSTAIPVKTRDRSAAKLDKWRKQAQLMTGMKVKTARSDNAPELMQAIERWSNENDVTLDYNAPYTPNQNHKIFLTRHPMLLWLAHPPHLKDFSTTA